VIVQKMPKHSANLDSKVAMASKVTGCKQMHMKTMVAERQQIKMVAGRQQIKTMVAERQQIKVMVADHECQ
jgi:hypothetical protein